MTYDVNYFIQKFEAIPDSRWLATGGLHDYAGDRHCAFGHCGHDGAKTAEGGALDSIFEILGAHPVAHINDGADRRYQQPTPKQRILAALYDIKKLSQPEAPKVKEVIRYVSVPETIKEQSKEIVLS